MYALDVAIQSLWTANASTLVAIVGGISPDLAAPGVAMPYAVTFQHSGGKLIRSFKPPVGTRIAAETCAVQISIFAGGRSNALQCAEAIASVFDDAQLNLASGTAIQCVRKRAIIVRTDIIGSLDQNGVQVWQGILYYDILVAP